MNNKIKVTKKVYVRFYDQNNLGNDLFLQILTDRYSDRFLIYRLCNSGTFIPSKDISVVYQNKILYFLDRILNRLFSIRSVLSLPIIHKNDLMIHIGGSLFMESSGLAYWNREKNYFDQIRIPYYILGCNVGPIYTEKFIEILRNIFHNAKDVCFRDYKSYNMFNDVPTTRVSTDVAFSLNKVKYESPTEKNAIISVINGKTKFDFTKSERYYLEILNLTKKLVDEGYSVTLMSFCKHEGDEEAIDKIINNMTKQLLKKVNTYFYQSDLDEAIRLISKSEIIISSRFHATILGLLFGKRVLPMAYSDKTTNILKDMGFKGPIIDINKIDEFNGSTFDFDSLRVNSIEEQIKLAELQFQELDKVLVQRA